MSDGLEQVLRIYQDAALLYESSAPSLDEAAALGYEVLYGPPVRSAPILFVGYQPGGGKFERLPDLTDPERAPPWPRTVDYANVETPFLLARRLQVAFGAEFLSRCTGMNAVFLRSPSMDAYVQTVPPVVRAEYEKMGTAATREIIGILQPRLIVAIGLVTMRLFAPDTNVVLRGEGDRALLSSGSLNGTPLFGMRHPSGAIPPPSDKDMEQIGAYLMRQLDESSA